MIKAFDTVASSGYLRFSRQVVVTTKELSSNVVCDFDQSDKLVAIECIDM